MAHWKHTATRCAVEGCDRTRKQGWSTCELSTHYPLGRSLYGAGRIDPIPAPVEALAHDWRDRVRGGGSYSDAEESEEGLWPL